MITGKVKWFNNAKGYGFIRPDEGGEDLFVHFSYIEMEGYKSLRAGQAVTYITRQADKGTHAVDVRFIHEENTTDQNGVSPTEVTPEQSGITQSEGTASNVELEPA